MEPLMHRLALLTSRTDMVTIRKSQEKQSHAWIELKGEKILLRWGTRGDGNVVGRTHSRLILCWKNMNSQSDSIQQVEILSNISPENTAGLTICSFKTAINIVVWMIRGYYSLFLFKKKIVWSIRGYSLFLFKTQTQRLHLEDVQNRGRFQSCILNPHERKHHNLRRWK